MKEIELTHGKITQVDDEDFEWLNQWKWRSHKGRYTFYARRDEKKITILMHRVILNVIGNIHIDHGDGNGCNNQRDNIRVCTQSQNQWNQRIRAGGSSIFKGVSWDVIKNKWGFLPYGGVTLSLYEMDDEVPDELVGYELSRSPFKSPSNFMVYSPKVAEALDEILNQNKDE